MVREFESQSQFTQVNGIFFNRSQLRIAQITDGTSNTYLAGEKCLSPDHYTDGMTWGDDGSTFIGFDGDTNRWTDQPPVQYCAGTGSSDAFGSAIGGGLNMVFCDGSVRFISYSIDLATHRCFGNREHIQAIDGSKF